jgi:DNA invertase Pin-like site-specific DNA recombinase
VLGVDIGKNVCSLVGLDASGKSVLWRRAKRETERQYDLTTKAQSLGCRPEQIRVLDRDLGQSGSAMTREDFKVLVGDVAMGRVCAIFSLEAPRLARSNQDWHRLLELCAITGTLVIDAARPKPENYSD